MAEATTREACIDRHRSYSIDISTRLNGMQLARIRTMVAAIRPGEHVLDVGCNSGYIADFLPRGCRGYGVDVSADLVRSASQRLAEVYVAPAEALPFPDKRMDVVILGEILEHVFDPAEVLREAIRVARRLVIGSTPHELGKWGPNGPRPPDSHKFHVRCFTEAELRDVLAGAGLTDIRITPIPREGVPQVNIFEGACSA